MQLGPPGRLLAVTPIATLLLLIFDGLMLRRKKVGKKIIKIKKLFKKFSSHVASCESARFVCSERTAFESWFRVELCPVLRKLGFKNIDFDYNYPDSGNKADLCVRTQRGDIVFELKSFVSDQDSNKKKKYPEQIRRLENLIHDPSGVLQVITFTTFTGRSEADTTFTGYSEAYMKSYCKELFGGSWQVLGPRKLINKYPLYVAITSMIR